MSPGPQKVILKVSKTSRGQSGKCPESLRKVSGECFGTFWRLFGRHFRDFFGVSGPEGPRDLCKGRAGSQLHQRFQRVLRSKRSLLFRSRSMAWLGLLCVQEVASHCQHIILLHMWRALRSERCPLCKSDLQACSNQHFYFSHRPSQYPYARCSTVSLVVILRNWVCDNWAYQFPTVGNLRSISGTGEDLCGRGALHGTGAYSHPEDPKLTN